MFVSFVAFIVAYTLRYRDFASMKVEYLFPAALAGVYLVCLGMERLRRAAVVVAGVVALLGLYVVDVALLVRRLA